MALSSSTHCSCSFASQLLPPRRPNPTNIPSSFFFSSSRTLRSPTVLRLAAAKSNDKTKTDKAKDEEVEEVEVEEELPWIQEKALDLVEFTGSVTQAIPGPRVGATSLPWILALPLAYAGITFVIAFVRTVKKFTSPRAKRKRLVLICCSFVCFDVAAIWVSCVFGY